ncbi:phage/plasmid primase, P4 family [Apilactobacillus xinyiensis]|uniref:phage/plasmid primase, P4 family n=1 Tax=Apilactobacillus xinyiensis TaxID=2841032 RepID=UPI00200EAE3E|nr:phage/plasmid primase, P4 family [Apilactobacillus xinyiensis]MCL0330804.1 phage/plasmid primase, P4 family [Apilactobacillus xinyiensis]
MTTWEYIQALSSNGICMYPLIKGTKRPAIKDMLNQATNDIEQLTEWFKPQLDGNVCCDVAINPSQSNLIVIDIDNHDNNLYGSKWVSDEEMGGYNMEPSVAEITPSHGLHYFYVNDMDIDIPNQLSLDKHGAIEVKTTSTIIYPSTDYRQTADEHTLINTPLTPMPTWLKRCVKMAIAAKQQPSNYQPNNTETTNVNAKAHNWLLKLTDMYIHGINQGSRNNQMVQILGKLFFTGADNQMVWKWFNHINTNYVHPSLKVNELKAIFKGIANKPHHVIQTENFSDMQQARKDAKRLVQQSRDGKLSYLAGARVMMKHFHFTRFSMEEGERVAVYVSDESSPWFGLYTRNYDYIKQLINAMYMNYSSKGIGEVLTKIELLITEVRQPEHTKDLIPVGNGIFNLKTKQLEPYTPEHVFSSKVSTQYNAKYNDTANIPEIDGWNVDAWLMNLAKDEAGNVDDQVYILFWQVLADALNGNYTRRKAILLNSEHGNSGKGTFQSLIANLVGQNNVATLKVNEFGERFAMSRLMGKSVCIGDDNPNGYIRDSSNFNSVITGDVVNIEYKGKDSFTTQLTPTVIQSFNGLPHFSNKGGTYRRMLIVPFRQHYQGDTDDWKIKDVYLKRTDVLEYVLFKALNAYSDFDKFITPNVSHQALQEFEKENDPIKEFVDEEFIRWDVKRISTKAVYIAYTRYCSENGYAATSRSKFVRQIQTILEEYTKGKVRISADDYNDLFSKVNDMPIRLLSNVDLSCHGMAIQCIYR